MKRARLQGSLRHRVSCNPMIGVISMGLALLLAMPATAATLDRVRQEGKLTLGYRVDARPFSYQDAGGKPTGYSVALCEKIADEVKTELNLPSLAVEWTPVPVDDRFEAVAQGTVDLLCGADTVTLSRRKEVSFSIGIFPSGIGAILRADAPTSLQEVLAGRPPSDPIWRASPARVLESKRFSVVKGTTAESWLAERLDTFQLTATTIPVENYDAGIKQVLNGDTDVFFGDRPILLSAARENRSASELTVLERQFTYSPLALALQRNDDDFRLLVDRTLSRVFLSGDFRDMNTTWFGASDKDALSYFSQSALPE